MAANWLSGQSCLHVGTADVNDKLPNSGNIRVVLSVYSPTHSAMLVGRRTWEVGERMEAEEPGSVDYPFSGPMFVLTHRPLERPDPEVRILSGDIGEAVAIALDAAGGKSLEILGADVAGQCLQRGLVDEVLVYVLPVLLGDGIRFSSSGVARTDLEPISSTRSGDATILRFRVRNQTDQTAE